MYTLKELSSVSIETALSKIERYRLLNEPWEAESICRDVLEIDPNNHRALIGLLLSLTDQFRGKLASRVEDARALLPRLPTEYERLYYAGIVCERKGKALLNQGAPGVGPVAYEWLQEAMTWYEKAEEIRPAGNDEAILRWNTCARLIMKHEHIRPAPDDRTVTMLE